jgi:hypothetical protein
VDALVWAEVRRHLEDPAVLLAGYARLQAEPAPRAQDLLAHEVRPLQKTLTELDRETQRLLDAYHAGLIELE